jgi:hypothetical protein
MGTRAPAKRAEDGERQFLGALPAPPTVAPEPLPDSRALELRYLDGLLLEHSMWAGRMPCRSVPTWNTE